MKKFSQVSFYEPKKFILVPNFGISWSQLQVLSDIGVQTRIFSGENVIDTAKFVSEEHDKNYFDFFPDYSKLVLIKNPYWRVLSIYIRYFLCNSEKDYKVLTFKRFLKKIYSRSNLNLQETYLADQFLSQHVLDGDNFLLCEDFSDSIAFWFEKKIDTKPLYNDSFKNLPNIYNMNMETLSDFYDHESADLVYTHNQFIFNKFGYPRFSYLDYHSPVKKIHVLHGRLTNYYER